MAEVMKRCRVRDRRLESTRLASSLVVVVHEELEPPKSSGRPLSRGTVRPVGVRLWPPLLPIDPGSKALPAVGLLDHVKTSRPLPQLLPNRTSNAQQGITKPPRQPR